MTVEEIIRKMVIEFDAILMACKIQGSMHRPKLKVIVDTKDGITMKKIVMLSKHINNSTELNDLLPNGFLLEVTSPGVDYPITERFQFERNINRKLHLFHTVQDLPNPIEGVLSSFDNDVLMIKSGKEIFKLSLSEIKYGKSILF